MEVKKEEGLGEIRGPIQMQSRMFRAVAVLKEVENGLKNIDKDEEIVCRVEHCSLLAPIERVWTNSRIGKTVSMHINAFCHVRIVKGLRKCSVCYNLISYEKKSHTHVCMKLIIGGFRQLTFCAIYQCQEKK